MEVTRIIPNMCVLIYGDAMGMLAGSCDASLLHGRFVVALIVRNGSGRTELEPGLGDVAFLSLLIGPPLAVFSFTHSATTNEERGMSRFTNIFDAAKEGTIEDVRFFVERQNVDVNSKEKESGNTPVLYAAGWNLNADVLQYLVSQGGKVNVKNSVDNTPLYFAARINSVKVLQILISNGAIINEKANCGNTPLHGAADYNSDVEVLKYLISQGADVNAKDYEDNTPFDVANTKEKKRILREAMSREKATYDLGNEKNKSEYGGIGAVPFVPTILFIVIVGGIIMAWGIFWGIVGLAVSGSFVGFLIGAYIGVGVLGRWDFWVDIKEAIVISLLASRKNVCDTIEKEGIDSIFWIVPLTILLSIVLFLVWDIPKLVIKYSFSFPKVAISGFKDTCELIQKAKDAR